MTNQQPSPPACKWCSTPLEEYSPGHFAGTFDPAEMFNYPLSQEEREAVDEILELSDQWKQAMRKAGRYIDPDLYYSRQDPRRYVISEHCFDKLLANHGLICLSCHDRYVDRKQGKQTNELGLH